MQPRSPSRVRFGVCECDLRAGVLFGAGTRTVLQEQPLQILAMLARAGGEIVTREEIKKRLWPNDTIVEFDHSIHTAIAKLRKALNDSADQPKYIETIPRRGYRLMVPVEWASADDSSAEESSADSSSDASDSGESADSDPEALLRARLQVGRLTGKIVSHYRVLEVIGGGGMGLVYRAEDLKLGRPVALKFLPEEVGDDPGARGRFEREAHAVSALNHPNICTVYDFDEHEGHPFIAMELLQGKTLRDYLAEGRLRLSQSEGPEIAVQIASGLEAAHEKGIIHRDIKPANIFITEKNVAKILDFGVAKIIQLSEHPHPGIGSRNGASENNSVIRSDDAENSEGEGSKAPYRDNAAGIEVLRLRSSAAGELTPLRMTNEGEGVSLSRTPKETTLTRTGMKLGTAGYMSPEQVRGEGLDARTDIFSFGLVLYEMATGDRAFAGETLALINEAILNRDPRPVREAAPKTSAKLETIITKCLEKARERRYQLAAQIVGDLEQIKRHQEIARRRVARWVAIVAAVLGVSMIAGLVWWNIRREGSVLPELKLRQLTFNSSENSVRVGSAISPDGKYLAYSDFRGSHIKRVETGEEEDVQLPQNAHPGVDWFIVRWFPDGTRILANGISDNHASVWTISSLSGKVQKLRDDAFAWSISPDGSLIAFTASSHGLWLMNADGGNARSVYEPDLGSSTTGAEWSPHGQRLLYHKADKSGDTLESWDLKTGSSFKVLSFQNTTLMSYIWLPDGRIFYLLRARNPNEDTCNYWEVRTSERTLAMAGEPRRVTNWAGPCTAEESVTADGKRVTFRQWTAQHSIYVADLEPDGTRIGTPRQLTPTKSANYPSAWTADSSAVVFNSKGHGRYGIYKQFLSHDSASPVLETLPGYRAYVGLKDVALPKISPDGKWVLYTIRDTLPVLNGLSGWTKLMRVRVSGGQPEVVMTGDFYGPPSCTHLPAELCVIAIPTKDQTALIFTAFDPQTGQNRELGRVHANVAGFAVDSNSRDQFAWSLSPDGRRIAFLDRSGGPIHIISLDGKPGQEVNVAGWHMLDSANWAMNGKGLYVSGRTLRGSVLLYTDLRGNPRILWTQEGGYETYAIPSPDGRHLAIKGWTLDSNIWMMENF